MKPGVLWVDLSEGVGQSVSAELRDEFQVQVVKQLRDVAVMAGKCHPIAIIFEFNVPSSEQLFALRECKRLFPSIPVLMLTEAHSELLAVWALRARVWDYLVKPFSVHKIHGLIQELSDRIATSRESVEREPWYPLDDSDDCRLRPGIVGAQRVVAEAKLYVQANLSEKIIASEVAERCGLSQFHFSRLFKRKAGITFSEYVLKARISSAMEGLRKGSAAVGEVAASVGFLDQSYFAKIFRRYAGMTPTEYLETHRTTGGERSNLSRRLADAHHQQERPSLRLPL